MDYPISVSRLDQTTGFPDLGRDSVASASVIQIDRDGNEVRRSILLKPPSGWRNDPHEASNCRNRSINIRLESFQHQMAEFVPATSGRNDKPARTYLAGDKGSPPCRVKLGFEPACAGGSRQMGSALAEAYRLPQRSSRPLCLMLAQNLRQHHVHSRGWPLYTMIGQSSQ